MFKFRPGFLTLAVPLALGACTVETFYAPISVEIVPADERAIVIRNLNPPEDCRIIRQDALFPAIYSVVYGPASPDAASRWASRNCRGAR
ncbi:MAG TPA: hypothetical protein PLQ11_07690 [Beijerinckiaceae bacterium]|nr:hypothetical protein [Beijerinckiaceae bacterium]